MSLNLGSTSIGSLYLGSTKIGEAYLGSTKVYSSVDPYNPLGLPPNTIRVKLNAYSSDPTDQGDSRVCVDAENKIWDITKNSNDWGTNTDGGERYLGSGSWLTHNLMIDEVLGANTSNVTNMEGLFGGYAFYLSRIALFDTRNVTNMVSFCNAVPITSIPKFDTRNVTDMRGMLQHCSQLTSLPLFDLSSVTDMSKAFFATDFVESGALALYQAASALPNVPTHTDTFKACGDSTQTGAAELAQIPPTWGGTMDYNPLNLPAYTLRCEFNDGYTPTMGESQSQVSSSPNVWDITKSTDNSWYSLFYSCTALKKVLGANASGITSLNWTFRNCTNLTEICLFDTSSVTKWSRAFNMVKKITVLPEFDTSAATLMDYMLTGCSKLTRCPVFDTSHVTTMYYMLNGCSQLSYVPLLDTSMATNTGDMLSGCTAVQGGALALYRQASSQATPPASHSYMFTNCGVNTTTGAAELAQIPASWGGTGA